MEGNQKTERVTTANVAPVLRNLVFTLKDQIFVIIAYVTLLFKCRKSERFSSATSARVNSYAV